MTNQNPLPTDDEDQPMTRGQAAMLLGFDVLERVEAGTLKEGTERCRHCDTYMLVEEDSLEDSFCTQCRCVFFKDEWWGLQITASYTRTRNPLASLA